MICVSLSEVDSDKCLELIRKYKFAEVRLDLVSYTSVEIEKIFSSEAKLIATCRACKLNDDERIAILAKSIQSGATYVDIEYESDSQYRETLIKTAKKYGTRIIISYHNYIETPDQEMLYEIIEKSVNWGADIVKIAAMSKSVQDNARILGLYSNKRSLVAFCMGHQGVFTRLASLFLGAEFTFAAPDEGTITAPGQMKYTPMKTLYDQVKEKVIDQRQQAK
jgi:3-dehydroquinate dehydratase type I